MTKRRKSRSGGRARHLQPVPAPEEMDSVEFEVAFDVDPLEIIETLYADLAWNVGKSRDPLEVERRIADWIGMTTQMVTAGVPDGDSDRALAGFLGSLIDVASRHATTEALALLRALSMLRGTPAAEVADAAAADLVSAGVADRAWVARVGQLRPTTCLRYGGLDGSQESVVAGFSYGRREHAMMVLIDHDLGGGIKDCWVSDQPDAIRQRIMTTIALDPMVEVGPIEWVRADRILSEALDRPVCAESDDQVSDVAGNLPLLRRRVDLLGGETWQPSGQRERTARTPRRAPADQDELFDFTPPPTAAASAVEARAKGTRASAARPTRSGASLQLKVTLAGSKPPIWRRVIVPESITLAQLHEVIQVVFGWTDSHLHIFDIDGEDYGPGGVWADTRSERVRLSSLVAVGERFRYVYDFGDDWRHTVQFEKRLPAGSGDGSPQCIAGRRAGPPEDCGGIGGYEYLLDVIDTADHADADTLEWAAGALGTTPAQLHAYDPAGLDRDEINAALRQLRP